MDKNEKKGSRIKPLHILSIVVVIIAVIGIAYVLVGNAGPVVGVGDTINVSYTGAFTNGTTFGSNVGGQPLTFTVGSGHMIKGFDQGVVGMKLNQEKTITIPANEAYGEVNSSLIIVVPANVFGNQTVEVGMAIGRTVNTVGGEQQEQQGFVTKVNDTNVTLDFNSPLAGHTLVFNIKILSIKSG